MGMNTEATQDLIQAVRLVADTPSAGNVALLRRMLARYDAPTAREIAQGTPHQYVTGGFMGCATCGYAEWARGHQVNTDGTV